MATDWAAHFKGIARRLFIPTPSRVPKILYHYTDAAGLEGMMRNSLLWATEHRFLNDESELEYTRAITRELVTNRLAKSEDNLKTEFYRKAISYQHGDSGDDIFVFSLSQERDDLSQWRGYAREGRGFTIGLAGSFLKKFHLPFSFFKMQYDPDKQRASVKEVMDQIISEMIRVNEAFPEETRQIVDRAGQYFAWCVEQRAASNKHKSFRSEREWRLVSYVPEKQKKGHTKTRVSGQKLVNYRELSLGGTLPIVTIGIGPGFRGADQRSAVEALCRETGYEVDIYDADTPYRRA